MILEHGKRVRIVAAAAVLAAVGLMADAARAAFVTTGTYDESTNQTNDIDTEAFSNNISLADFKTLIADAFANDLGGVVDFDTTESGTTGLGESDASTTGSRAIDSQLNQMHAVYGVSGAKGMVITRTHRDSDNTVVPQTSNDFQVGVSVDDTFESISGASAADADQKYLYSTGTGSYGFRLYFSQPITAFGLTALSRGDSASFDIGMKVVLNDDTEIIFDDETMDATAGTDDTFFGYIAPSGMTIKYVRLQDSGIVVNEKTIGVARYDDLAFIVVDGLPGDFNDDGFVDSADYVTWRKNYGGDESALNGNGDGSGTIDEGDYDVWRGGFGNPPISAGAGSALGSAQQVPEPAFGFGALAFSLMAARMARRNRRNSCG
ncbi:MAG: hypothetical protein IT425_07500 [Pirellulales bacterium]|nr:hypothetical protein [Pirellulales bacterium]